MNVAEIKDKLEKEIEELRDGLVRVWGIPAARRVLEAKIFELEDALEQILDHD